MQKISSILFFMVISSLLGCQTEELECTDSNHFISLNVLTADNVDSIHFLLNNRNICHGNVGNFYNLLICGDSSVNGYLSAIEIDDPSKKCEISDKKTIWKNFHCFIGNSSDEIDVDSSALSLEIFTATEKSTINISQVISGGLYINILPESDTTKWFGYEQNPIRPYFSEYQAPSSSTRLGCNDGYCVAALPIVEKEFCFDK